MIWSALKNNLVISLSALCFSLAFLSSCGKKETPSTESPSSKEETTSGSPKSSTSSNKPVSEPAAEEPVPVEPKEIGRAHV